VRFHHVIFQLRLFFVFALLATATACVSVNVKPATPKHADHLAYTAPPAPFAEQDSNGSADKVWQSQKTGNTIAVLSECKTEDTRLEYLEKDTINAMTDPKVEATSRFTYNEREAIQTTATGLMDGIGIEMKVVTFKKNGCDFVLTYVGRSTSFARELDAFDDFLKGFKAP
jgi:hypothetical protein